MAAARRGRSIRQAWQGLGLRRRVSLAFGGITLVLAVAFALVVWFLVLDYVLARNEALMVSSSSANARELSTRLQTGDSQLPDLLDGLAHGPGSVSLLQHDGRWYATAPLTGPHVLPADLVQLVGSGTPATQRVEVDGKLALVAGIPLPDDQGSYFQVGDLGELSATLTQLQLTLAAAVGGMAVAALLVGSFSSRLALRPLVKLNQVATAVARGEPGARFEVDQDPDLRLLARSFNDTAEALRRRVQADARFAGDVSHELRTPLTTMLNSLHLIENRRDQLPEAVREPLDLLAGELERFRRLVVDLIEISRNDSSAQVHLERVLIADAVVRAADTAAGRPVTRVAPDVQPLALSVDKRRLDRLVANLVDNADHHGRGCVGVQVLREGGSVRIEVDDRGPGVPDDRKQRIFERFVHDGAGVGLGLAIVVRHVQAHGGSIEVLDRAEGGARFVVRIPVVRR